MASNKLNIHVTYGTTTGILISTRRDFLREVCRKYNLKEHELEIFDIKNKKYIGIGELKDLMKVEIKKKTSYALNGRSGSPDRPGPPVQKETDRQELVKKLLDNRSLTGKERAFIVNMLEGSYNPPLKRNVEDDSPRPEMKNRKVQVDAANLITSRSTYSQTDELINFKPSLNTSIAANDIMIQSKRLASSEKIDAAVANDLMTKTFDKRRNFILLERPFASFVKEKYPLLFSNAEVKNELDRIFYSGKCTEFLENIKKFAPYILSIAREDDPLLLTTRKKMNEFETRPQEKLAAHQRRDKECCKSYAEEVGAILMLSSLVHEGRGFLKLKDSKSNPSDLPYIECQANKNDLYFDQYIFKIYVERIVLCEASDFKEAILCLLAGYFIFNIRYPDENFSTLVAFEKLFLEANDTDESDIDLAVRQIIRSIQLKWKAKTGS